MSQRKKRPRAIEDSDDEDYSTPTQQRSRRSHESFIGRRRSRDQPSTSTDIAFDIPVDFNEENLTPHQRIIRQQNARSVLRRLDEPSTSTVFTSDRRSAGRASQEIWRDRFGRGLLRSFDEPSTSTDYTYDRPSARRSSPELTDPEPSSSIASGPRRNPPRSCRSLYGHRNVSIGEATGSHTDDNEERLEGAVHRNLPVPPAADDDSDDGIYENQPERDIHQRTRYVRRVTTAEYRRRALRALETSDSEDDDGGEIKQPEVLIGDRVCRLGDAEGHLDLRCHYCGAMSFKTIFKMDRHRKDIPYFQDPRDCICCDGGKVFVPPMKKRPEAIERLSENRKTKEQLVSYNTCFSFASIQYHKVPAAPFGLPVAKTLGPIRHFPSAALPFDPKKPRFGNYYLYMGDEAVNLRMQGFSHLDKEVVKQVQAAMEKCHPFAHTLRTMGDVIENVKKSNEDEDMVRLRIIDAKRVPKALLQGSHPGLYRDPLQCGDSVALFYSATKEQDVFPPGFIIYPRKNNKVQLPMFPWDPRINSFCYPLLFPYGEYGFRHGKLPLAEDPTDWYVQRLMDWAVKNPALAVDWDLDYTFEELRDLCANDPGDYPLRFGASDPNIVESANEDEEEEEDDDSFDQLLHEEANFRDTGSRGRQQVVERGGQYYPQPSSGEINENDDDNMEHYEDDATIRGILNDPSLSQQINLHGDVEGNDLTVNEQRIDFLDATEPEEYPIGELSSAQPLRRDEDANENEGYVHSESGGEINDDDDVEVPPHRQLELDPSEQHEVQHRKNVTERQYALYIHQMRKTIASDRACARNRFTSSGKLGQVFLLDLATRMYQQRSSYQRKHHTDYVNSTKTKFLQALQRRAGQLGRTIGCVSTVPQSVAGSPRHLQQLYEHTVAMSRTKHGKPDCFITLTTNVNWPEIQNNLPPGDNWSDHPQHVVKYS